MKVPDLDSSIGMEVYSTDIQGIGGSIRLAKDHFMVEEILDRKAVDIVETRDDEHEYPLFLLHKEGIDSNHALREVEISTGLKLKAVGLKDAKAITRQFVSALTKNKNGKIHVVTGHCKLNLVGYTKRPITKAGLAGNIFTIRITSHTKADIEKNVDELDQYIHENSIANFYGYQRFGSSRPVTHLFGREIVRRDFRQAVEVFLCHPDRYDNREISEIRDACRDPSNYEKVLKVMPQRMDLERILLHELIRSSDPVRALRKIPLGVRRLFVQAYQSYLFNKTLSKLIKEAYDITTPKSGDICMQIANDGVVVIKRFEENSTLQLPAVPLVGYAFRDDNRFGSAARSIMEEENVSKDRFYIKEMQEISVEGGFRPASLVCRDFSHTLEESLTIKFELKKGCYATVLLRELMKPKDPLEAGF